MKKLRKVSTRFVILMDMWFDLENPKDYVFLYFTIILDYRRINLYHFTIPSYTNCFILNSIIVTPIDDQTQTSPKGCPHDHASFTKNRKKNKESPNSQDTKLPNKKKEKSPFTAHPLPQSSTPKPNSKPNSLPS